MKRVKKPYRPQYGLGKVAEWNSTRVTSIHDTVEREPGNTHTRPVKLTGKRADVLSHEHEVQPERLFNPVGHVPVVGHKHELKFPCDPFRKVDPVADRQ